MMTRQPAADPHDPDRFMDLQLQHAAQLADQARKERDLALRVDKARTVISLIKAALATYVPDGTSSDAFRMTIDGAFLKLGALHASIADTVYADTLATVLGEMRVKFEADGWTPPENTNMARIRASAAEQAGTVVLDADEQIQLGELHLRMAREHLQRGNMQHAERELAKGRSFLTDPRIRVPAGTQKELSYTEQLYANIVSVRTRS